MDVVSNELGQQFGDHQRRTGAARFAMVQRTHRVEGICQMCRTARNRWIDLLVGGVAVPDAHCDARSHAFIEQGEITLDLGCKGDEADNAGVEELTRLGYDGWANRRRVLSSAARSADVGAPEVCAQDTSAGVAP